MDLADKLVVQRKKKGISQEELADMTGKSCSECIRKVSKIMPSDREVLRSAS